jgi:hypothetical protein
VSDTFILHSTSQSKELVRTAYSNGKEEIRQHQQNNRSL